MSQCDTFDIHIFLETTEQCLSNSSKEETFLQPNQNLKTAYFLKDIHQNNNLKTYYINFVIRM